MPARGVGPIAEEHAFRYLDLGKKIGIFTPTNALSERGETLRAFYAADHPGEHDWTAPDPNPLLVDTRASQVILLDALLREDALLPLMLMEFVKNPEAGIATALKGLTGPDWSKVRNFLNDPRSLTFLDRMHHRLESAEPGGKSNGAG